MAWPRTVTPFDGCADHLVLVVHGEDASSAAILNLEKGSFFQLGAGEGAIDVVGDLDRGEGRCVDAVQVYCGQGDVLDQEVS